MKKQTSPPVKLSQCVKRSVKRYFKDLNGEPACGLYQLVLGEMERPLLEIVMKQTEQNQSKAAKILGINRNTLRKKLDLYDITS